MNALTVLYDAGCPLCRRAQSWLEREPQLVPLRFVPAGSAEARRRFPDLDHAGTLKEITVVGYDGSVYIGERAWLICLWALRDYREWSLRLAEPALLPTVRGVVNWVSANRFRVGAEAACDDESCHR